MGALAARGRTPRCTEIGAAPGWQGATREQIGAFVTEEQRRQTGCSANRMQWGFYHGLLDDPAGGGLQRPARQRDRVPPASAPSTFASAAQGRVIRSLETQ